MVRFDEKTIQMSVLPEYANNLEGISKTGSRKNETQEM